MSLWEPSSTSLTESDHTLIDESVALLETVGVYPHLGVEHEDIEDSVADDLALFRRRPLLTLLGACDPDDDRVFYYVFVDDSRRARTTRSQLLAFFTELAESAGSLSQVSDLFDFPDANSPGSGSLRFQVGEWDVHDLEYDLDPDFGDVCAELRLPQLVALPGMTALTYEGACHSNPLTVWVDTLAAEETGFGSLIEAELAH
ncbi:hypothetical protein [Corynebacterium lubricantis]|uniref:hypothetical protein n=1 Tax=Corynebacterium lubricantis TaxID=541095 RepID=UPI000374C9E5|nr:hypothetical protein [Corynebacterium lubricantis]